MSRDFIKERTTDIAPLIHQAALDPYCNSEEIDQLCDLSLELGFSGLCTSLIHLKTARKRLGAQAKTKLIAVISFPFGFCPTEIKLKEVEWAAEIGAEELDVVPSFTALHKGKEELFAEELAQICNIGLPVRSIINISSLSSSQLELAVEASIEAGVHGIQSGNGFGPQTTSIQIKELATLVRDRCSIKAVGGIKSLPCAMGLVEAGANYIGTRFGYQIIRSNQEPNK